MSNLAHSPVPYTREAIARVRNGASANELGWSQTFYERVCHDNGVTPVKMTTVEAPAQLPRPEDARATLRRLFAIASEPWGQRERRKVVVQYTLGPARVTTITLNLTQRETLLLLTLVKFIGSPTAAEFIAARIGGGRAKNGVISKHVAALSAHFTGTPLDVVGNKGRSGGFMLVKAGTSEPPDIAILSVAEKSS